VAKLHEGSRSFVAGDFNRSTMRNALKGNSAVHIATHLRPGCGQDRDRLADVGLELSMGDALCAREVRELKPSLPLVVIDACETAEGRFVDAEGLQGLARAFLESGTRNLIVTLWPVQDEAARQFAVEFHGALIEGQPVSVAAASARRALRLRGTRTADWSAFRAIARD
jgi:CHAT domain-containing protein